MATQSPQTLNEFLIEEKPKARTAIAAANGIEYPAGLLGLASTAKDFKAGFPELTNQLESAIKYGNPAQLSEAGRAITMLKSTNPIAIKGLDKDAQAVATLYNAFRTNMPGKTQQEIEENAARKARDDVYNLTDEARAEVMRKFEFEMTDKKYATNDVALNKQIASKMDLQPWYKGKLPLPQGLTETVRQLLPSYYMRVIKT